MYVAPPPAPTNVTNGVPITLEGRRAMVPVTLGSKAAMMLIDTGCTDMTVTRQMAVDLIAAGQATTGLPVDVTFADGSTKSEMRKCRPMARTCC